MREQSARVISRIAGRQHGVVSYEQLLWAGLSSSAVSRWRQVGRLQRLYRGVYAVGHAGLNQEGRWLAAVFACGAAAVLGFDSAAALWNMLTVPTSAPAHVVVPGYSGRKKRPGIVIHRSATLIHSDTTRRHNIPVTTPTRTRRDMGWTKEPTRSHLEREFLRLLRAHDLPLPEVNAKLGPYEVDFVWRDARLVVELDGYAYHSDRGAFEADRRRDRDLQTRGYVVLRFTYREVVEEHEAVAAALAVHLQHRTRH
jgi:very-short-patch-repair endonuclease